MRLEPHRCHASRKGLSGIPLHPISRNQMVLTHRMLNVGLLNSRKYLEKEEVGRLLEEMTLDLRSEDLEGRWWFRVTVREN